MSERLQTINEKIRKTLKVGRNILEMGSIEEMEIFLKRWDHVVDDGIKPTVDMWKLYNAIQETYGKPLTAVKYSDDTGHRIKKYGEITETLKEMTNSFQRAYRDYHEWLIFRKKLPGNCALIEIYITNPDTSLTETWYIANRQSKWNPKGIERSSFEVNKRNFIRDSGFFEEVQLSSTGLVKYDPILKKTTRIRNPIKEALVTQLEVHPDFGYLRASKRPKWFVNAYQLKYDADLVDEYLEILFWTKLSQKKLDLDSTFKVALKKHYEQIGRYVQHVTNDIVPTELTKGFDIYLVDKSCSLLNLFDGLDNFVARSIHNDLVSWWFAIKQKVSAADLARVIQKAKMSSLHRVPITYNLEEANLSQFGPLTDNPIRFWTEQYPDGISAMIAAMIQDQRMRNAITKFSKELYKIGTLDLSRNVISEIIWAHDATDANVATLPDNITRLTLSGEASEIIQNKLLRKIGDGTKEANSITPRSYLLDWLKTTGNYDPLTGKTINLQIEIIRKGETLGGLTNITKTNNALILSYWGGITVEIGRIAEVSQLIRIGRYYDKITDAEKLSDYVLDGLNRGRKSLGFSRHLGMKTQKLVTNLIDKSIKVGETKFLRNIILEILIKMQPQKRKNN